MGPGGNWWCLRSHKFWRRIDGRVVWWVESRLKQISSTVRTPRHREPLGSSRNATINNSVSFLFSVSAHIGETSTTFLLIWLTSLTSLWLISQFPLIYFPLLWLTWYLSHMFLSTQLQFHTPCHFLNKIRLILWNSHSLLFSSISVVADPISYLIKFQVIVTYNSHSNI